MIAMYIKGMSCCPVVGLAESAAPFDAEALRETAEFERG